MDVPRTERYNRLSYWDMNVPSPIAGKVPGFPNLDRRDAVCNTRQSAPGPHRSEQYRPALRLCLPDQRAHRVSRRLRADVCGLRAAGGRHLREFGTEGFQSSTGETISNDGGRTFASSLSNPFPNGFNFPLGAVASPVSGPSTNLGLGVGESIFNDWQNPIIQQWNGTLQREVKGGILIEAGYIGSKGQHLIDGESSMAMNQLPASYFALGNQLLGTNQVANPFYGIITNPTSSLSQPTVAYSQLLKPFPQYTSVSPFRKPQANSLYHSFTLRVEKRFSHGLNLLLELYRRQADRRRIAGGDLPRRGGHEAGLLQPGSGALDLRAGRLAAVGRSASTTTCRWAKDGCS